MYCSDENESTKLIDALDDEEETSYGDDSIDSSLHFPHTYVVLKFSRKATSECIEWLARRIQGPRDEGGAELLVRRQPSSFNKTGPVILHISASKIKLLEVAEEMEVRVKDLSGREREFMVADIDDYIPPGNNYSIEDLFPMSERQRIVHRQLHIAMRALSSEEHVPGHPKIKLNLGESIVQALLRERLLDSQYILHDEEVLKKLGPKWYYSVFGNQPLEEVNTYFGEAVTLYFTFLGYYTKALCIPMLLGLLQIVFATTISQIFFLPFFCFFNVLWVTLFLQLWKQKCSELAFAWGTIGMSSLDEPRPGFRGEPNEDPITGQLLPQYPRWKTYSKMYLVSIPIVLICLAVALYIMLVFFWVDEHLCRTHWLGFLAPHSEEDAEEESQIMFLLRFTLPLLPGCIYAALVYAMNWIYRRFATALTEWENHRTQSQFDRHRVVKLILFEFVNNFMALFYIAFYLQDMAMLKFQLGIMLIFLQLVNNIQEALLPIWFTKMTSSLESKVKKGQDHSEKGGNLISSVLRKRKPHSVEAHGKSGDEDDPYLSSIPCLDEDDPRIEQAIREGKKYPYEGTYDDYLELFMQFGYVFLFASAYPAAAFWAVLNNYIEIRSDAFKLCHILQRPLAKRVKDTGAWQRGFEAMGSLSVMTNCAFLGIFIWKAYTVDTLSTEYEKLEEADAATSELGEISGPMGLSLIHWALVVVAVEHVLLLVQCLLNNGIPDRPEHVRVSLAQQAYCSRQALKQQKSLERKKQLRRHNTVHGRS